MNPFSQSNLAALEKRIDNAIALLEEHADMPSATRDPTLVGRAYGQILQARGILHAVGMLEAMEAEVGAADTERSPAMLRVVR